MIGGAIREARSIYSEYLGISDDFPTIQGAALDGNRDMYNNAVGIAIADFALSHGLFREDVELLTLDALNSGQLITRLDDPRLDRFPSKDVTFPGISVDYSPTENAMNELADRYPSLRQVNQAVGVTNWEIVRHGDTFVAGATLDRPGQWTSDGWDSDEDGDVDASDSPWDASAGDRPRPRPGSYDTGQHDSSAKPVIIDLDGDGLEVIPDSSISFDWDFDGYKENGAWVSSDDGFLIVDQTANGSISGAGDGRLTRKSEFILSEAYPDREYTDLEALAKIEDSSGNGDGVLDSKDVNLWESIKIWKDADRDGDVDVGEMKQAEYYDIKKIAVRYDGGITFSSHADSLTTLGVSLLGSASY